MNRRNLLRSCTSIAALALCPAALTGAVPQWEEMPIMWQFKVTFEKNPDNSFVVAEIEKLGV